MSTGTQFEAWDNLNLLILDLSNPPALNVITRLAGMGTGSPVLGLRPGRAALLRTSKLPNPEILTS